MSKFQDELTYRAPRTQQEAFGPYTSHELHQKPSEERLHKNDIVVLAGCITTVLCVVLAACLGWIK